jgi:hypothetical protein
MDQAALDVLFPFVLCALAGAALAVFELIKTFGKWIGRYWTDRYVVSLLIINMITAMLVYAFLRYALGVQSTFWLALITGLTFPAILRSRFTFYRPFGSSQGALDTAGFSLAIDGWYRKLQSLCYEEVNSQIADARNQKAKRLRDGFSEKQMIDLLTDHIDSELMPDQKRDHLEQLADIRALTDAAARKRRLALLMVDLLPEQRVKQLLKGRP